MQNIPQNKHFTSRYEEWIYPKEQTKVEDVNELVEDIINKAGLVVIDE